MSAYFYDYVKNIKAQAKKWFPHKKPRVTHMSVFILFATA